ncbi:MAG: hypothetical protein JWO95_3015 [Verrucomicrobiales bacterium]|nr:hypothetical protein [Verrucomicrobiales bacterium]
MLLCALSAFAAEKKPDRNCGVCGRLIPLGEQTWMLKADSDRLSESIRTGLFTPSQVYTNIDPKNPNGLSVGVYICVCDQCHNIGARCSVCGLHIKEKGIRTGDGRWICSRDVPVVVMDEDAARTLFESAREAAVDVVGNFFALTNPAVNVRVTDVFDRKTGADKLHTVAISKSTDSGSGVVHYVSVYTGSWKRHAFYSCVHEYTHLWINENIGEHKIEDNTREGLCELVAYKVAEARGDAAEQKRILANTYTKGRIKDLVQYATEEDLQTVLNWIPHGTTRVLAEGMATATALKNKAPEIPLDVRIAQAQSFAPVRPRNDALALNGIIHTPRGTVILLNGGLILAKGQSGVMKLHGEQTRVRCVEIQTGAATVEVATLSSTNAVTLKLAH